MPSLLSLVSGIPEMQRICHSCQFNYIYNIVILFSVFPCPLKINSRLYYWTTKQRLLFLNQLFIVMADICIQAFNLI